MAVLNNIEILPCLPTDVRFVAAGRAGAAREEIEQNELHVCLLALDDGGRPVGRVAIYHNRAIRHKGAQTVQLGHFACLDDEPTACALLHAALAEGSALGAGFALGPMNGSTWSEYRFITDTGSEPRFLTEPAHPAYYPALWQSAGFEVCQQYQTDLATIPAKFTGEVGFFDRHGLTVRDIRLDDFEVELAAIYPLCMAAFAPSPYFSPIDEGGFRRKMSRMRTFINPTMTKLACDATGAPVGFFLCLPDLYDPAGQRCVTKTIAKSPACQVPGVIMELYKLVLAAAHEAGYRQAVHALIHEDNVSRKRSAQFAGERIRGYSLFIAEV